jgi:hypothetical protein
MRLTATDIDSLYRFPASVWIGARMPNRVQVVVDQTDELTAAVALSPVFLGAGRERIRGAFGRVQQHRVGSLVKIVIHVAPVEAKKATVMRIGADLCLGWQMQRILDLRDQVFAVEDAGISEDCEFAR